MATQVELFKTYSEYKENKGILDYDLKRIDVMEKAQSSTVTNSLKQGMQKILENHEAINNPLSMESFSIDMKNLGWKNLERMTKEIGTQCDSEKFDLLLCNTKLNELKSFVTSSNLNVEHKSDVLKFINDYSNERSALFNIGESFNTEFDKNIEDLNRVIQNHNENKAPVVVKVLKESKGDVTIAPMKKTDSLVSVIHDKNIFNAENVKKTLGVSSLVILTIVLIAAVKKKIDERKINVFYDNFFKVQKLTGIKVRVFGRLNLKSYEKLNSISEMILKLISKRRTFFGEMQFHFSENEKVVKLETKYLGSDSLQAFYEEKTGELSSQFRSIIEAVEDVSGEVIFSTKIDEEGNILNSSLQVYMPKSLT